MAEQGQYGGDLTGRLVPEGVGIITETFMPQIELAVASAEQAEGAQIAAETRLTAAQDMLQTETARLRQIVDARQSDFLATQGVASSQERLLGLVRDSAVRALHASDLPASETIVAQATLEGRSKGPAEAVLERVASLNEYLRTATVEPRVIILGRAAVQGATGAYGDLRRISFIDLSLDTAEPTITIEREDGKHRIGVLSDAVSQFVPYTNGFDDHPTRDSRWQRQLLGANPEDVLFVGTDDQVDAITDGRPLDSFAKVQGSTSRRALRVSRNDPGAPDKEGLPSAIIFGAAFEKFIGLMAENEYLRAMVFATLAASNKEANDEASTRIDNLPPGEVLKHAKQEFIDGISRQAGYIVERSEGDFTLSNNSHGSVNETNPFLSRQVQYYLGIDYAEIEQAITKTLAEYVEVGVDDFDATSIDTIASVCRRNDGSVDEMCDYLEERLGAIGYDLSEKPSVMAHIKRDLKINALEAAHAKLGEGKADRRKAPVISAAIVAIRAATPE